MYEGDWILSINNFVVIADERDLLILKDASRGFPPKIKFIAPSTV